MGLMLLMASGASAAQPKCLVANAGTGQSYGTLQEGVDSVSAGSATTLSVSGTCHGDTNFSGEQRVAIVGRGHATLAGDNSALKPGTVLRVFGDINIGAAIVTITDLTITGGYEGRGFSGRGIAVGEGGWVTLNNSTVTGNTGGGIATYEGGGTTLNNSKVTGNTTSGNGGGMATYFGGAATLNNSTVSGNSASGCGGGLYDTGEPSEMTLNDSSVTRNTSAGNGGGVCVEGEGFRAEFGVTLNGSSSVGHNTASGNGGGVYNEGVVKLNDSASVTHNTAFGKGGGIYNHQTVEATIAYGIGWSGTVSRNKPDDIFNF
jgi:predicted outer membrane repeat protein